LEAPVKENCMTTEPTTQPAGASDAAIAYVAANDALAAWHNTPRNIGRDLDADELDEVSRLENATDAAYEALKAAIATPPAQVAGSGMGELVTQWRHNAQGCGRKDAQAAEAWRSCARQLEAAITAQPAPVVDGDRVSELSYTILFNAIADATVANPMNTGQRPSIDVSVARFKESVTAALSARPAVEGAQGASGVSDTGSFGDNSNDGDCPCGGSFVTFCYKCGEPDHSPPATGSGGEVTVAMARAFKVAHDEHAATKIYKIFAAGQREEANIIVGLRAALELATPAPARGE
jgi:hypothetical protein